MLRVMMIDDEVRGMEVLHYDINKLNLDVEIVGKFSDPVKGLEALRTDSPDLLLLDIEMPWMNGFELLDKLDRIDFDVIFITAYDQHAIKAFKYAAVDYLLKPVDLESLQDALQRVINRQQVLSQSQLNVLLSAINNTGDEISKLVIPTIEGFEFIEINDIIRCQASGNYCTIYLKQGNQFLASRHLKHVEGLLPAKDFYRVHQSHLINLKHIKRYSKTDGGHVVMGDGSEVAVARSRKDEFLMLFQRRGD